MLQLGFGLGSVLGDRAQLDTRLKCLSAGAAFYLRKPFDDNDLLQAVADAMNGLPTSIDTILPAH